MIYTFSRIGGIPEQCAIYAPEGVPGTCPARTGSNVDEGLRTMCLQSRITFGS